MATAIMKQKEVPEMDDVEEIISKISEDSPYKRRPTQKRTWMTVPEMGKLLGLKKTDRYWLVPHRSLLRSAPWILGVCDRIVRFHSESCFDRRVVVSCLS